MHSGETPTWYMAKTLISQIRRNFTMKYKYLKIPYEIVFLVLGKLELGV